MHIPVNAFPAESMSTYGRLAVGGDRLADGASKRLLDCCLEFSAKQKILMSCWLYIRTVPVGFMRFFILQQLLIVVFGV